MQLTVIQRRPTEVEADALVVNLFEGENPADGPLAEIDAAAGGVIGRAVDLGEVKGKLHETTLLLTSGRLPVPRLLVVGSGQEKAFSADRGRTVAGTAIRALRGRFPDAFIVNVIHPRCADIFKASPYCDMTLPRPLGGFQATVRFLSELRRFQFTQAVSFSRSSLGLALIGRLAARRVLGLANPRIARFMTETVPEADCHMVENCLDLAKALGAEPLGAEMEMPIASEDQFAAERFLAEAGWVPGQPLVGISPGASRPENRWPLQRFAEFVGIAQERLGARVLIVGGPEDADSAAAIGGQVSPRPIIAAGQTGIAVSGALISRCAVFVAADTGPLHLASAVGTPVVGIYGPANPRRTGIYGRGVLLRGDTSLGRIPSVEEVTTSMVVAAVTNQISSS